VTRGTITQILPWSTELAGSMGKDMNLQYDHLLNRINDGSFSRRVSR
jgi:hypothetical protein